MRNVKGFTATHGLDNIEKGPHFWWKDGKCTNSMTVNSWWHQNFILEYDEMETIPIVNPDQMEMNFG